MNVQKSIPYPINTSQSNQYPIPNSSSNIQSQIPQITTIPQPEFTKLLNGDNNIIKLFEREIPNNIILEITILYLFEKNALILIQSILTNKKKEKKKEKEKGRKEFRNSGLQ